MCTLVYLQTIYGTSTISTTMAAHRAVLIVLCISQGHCVDNTFISLQQMPPHAVMHTLENVSQHPTGSGFSTTIASPFHRMSSR